jgi:hypothetical protein
LAEKYLRRFVLLSAKVGSFDLGIGFTETEISQLENILPVFFLYKNVLKLNVPVKVISTMQII